jgi:hypothetical protein
MKVILILKIVVWFCDWFSSSDLDSIVAVLLSRLGENSSIDGTISATHSSYANCCRVKSLFSGSMCECIDDMMCSKRKTWKEINNCICLQEPSKAIV